MTAVPELPEVEAIKRVIEPQIQGLAIEQVMVNRPEVVAHPSADEFCTRITGQFFHRNRPQREVPDPPSQQR